MRSIHRTFRFTLIALLATLVGGFFLITWIDPWQVAPMPWTSSKFDEFRSVEKTATRTRKAGLSRSEPWNAALFGSSRVDIAFNPTDTAFPPKTVNLGLDGAGIYENTALFRHFMEKQSPSLVVFLIDLGDLSKPDPANNTSDFATSPLQTENVQILERELRYHTGISALSSALKVLGRRISGTPGDHTPEGFRRVAARLENPAAQIASLYLSTTWRMARDRAIQNGINGQKMKLVQEIIETCRKKDARLVLVIPPNHAGYQFVFPELKDADPYFALDRHALVDAVAKANDSAPAAKPIELWDFQDLHPLNCPPLPLTKGAQMEHWIDLYHFTPDVGSLIARRIQGEAGDYGIRLNRENVDVQIEKIRVDLDKWGETYPDDLAFLRRSLKSFGPLPANVRSR